MFLVRCSYFKFLSAVLCAFSVSSAFKLFLHQSLIEIPCSVFKYFNIRQLPFLLNYQLSIVHYQLFNVPCSMFKPKGLCVNFFFSLPARFIQ